jgi:antitoxin VapB
MSMNIKDPAIHAMAKEIAAQTGESVTEVVRVALQQRKQALEDARGKGRASRTEIRAILDQIHALPKLGPKIDHAELLYDEYGLPK